MNFRSQILFVLLLVLSVTVLWGTISTVGSGSSTMKEYTAYEVSHQDTGLVMINERTGKTRTATAVNTDDRVACLPSGTPECDLLRKDYRGEINSSGYHSQFEYVYIDDDFYRIDTGDTTDEETEYRQTSSMDAFATLARESGEVTDTQHEAIADGSVITTESVPNTNRIVAHDERYYTIVHTGTKTYSGLGSTCFGGTDDFCERTDQYRIGHWARTLGMGLLGVIGTVIASTKLFMTFRSTDT